MRQPTPWIATALLGLVAACPALADDKPARPANRLARETSPYLLQHAHNPVDWYPWGPEAFEKAKAEGKPVFLSVGYSSCYWCHVMERETFEDAAIAKELNERFVSIKVDREERPDVDGVYMAALQAYAGSGGWPMTAFLFPDGSPFFAATYFPPRDREGMEGFASLIDRVSTAYRDHRPALEKDADGLTKSVRDSARSLAARRKATLSPAMIAGGLAELGEQFDPDFGGFGYDAANPRKPKFPEPSNLAFLLHRDRPAGGVLGKKGPDPKSMALATLDHLARGGIRDHLGGGYHRYSTNRSWSVPHFEKMLYDNAQMAGVLLLAYERTGDERWRREVKATLDFIARDLTGPSGGFYSTIDAETGGQEGAYYVWTAAEVRSALDSESDFAAFEKSYGMDRGPNFEGGRYVLQRRLETDDLAKALDTTPEALEARLAPMRAKLLALRSKRSAPRLDDKVLTSWNGLAIAAFADAARVLKDDRALKRAEAAADFLWTNHRDAEGRLLRTSRGGAAKGAGYLEDYAFLAHGLLRLHAATGDPKRLAQARELTDRMLAEFADAEDGGFFVTSEAQETLLARMKDPFDNALPGGNSVGVRNLVALHRLTNEPKYLDAARKALESLSPALDQMPAGVPLLLVGLDEFLAAQGKPEATTDPAEGFAPASVVEAQAVLAPGAKAGPGAEVDVILTLKIKDGYHLYANPSGSEAVKPTRVELPAASPATLISVEYPGGRAFASPGVAGEKVDIYEGETRITARVRLDEKGNLGDVALQVRYQACNDRACLAPARLRIKVSTTVK